MIKNGLLILFGNKLFLGLGTKSFKITTKVKMDILKIDFFFFFNCVPISINVVSSQSHFKENSGWFCKTGIFLSQYENGKAISDIKRGEEGRPFKIITSLQLLL